MYCGSSTVGSVVCSYNPHGTGNSNNNNNGGKMNTNTAFDIGESFRMKCLKCGCGLVSLRGRKKYQYQFGEYTTNKVEEAHLLDCWNNIDKMLGNVDQDMEGFLINFFKHHPHQFTRILT